jgi:hypothetical protein
MRIARLVGLGLLLAAVVSAVALAVDKGSQGAKDDDDAPEATVTVTGLLHATGGRYAVGSRAVSLGPPWYAAGSALVRDRLGKTVTVTGSADEDDGGLSVRTIDGVTYRAQGRPPWAGGPKHHGAAACKAKAEKAKTEKGEDEKTDDEKTDDEKSEASEKDGHGPPPWANANGRRCKA